jgi:chromosome segregation ATPase
MLDVMELVLAALVVATIALFLRLRQAEPAAVARVSERLAAVREELAAVEVQLADRATLLAPLEAERDELERSVAALRVAVDESESLLRRRDEEIAAALAERSGELARLDGQLVRTRADLDAAQVMLAQQRALRAEAEAALRAARSEQPRSEPPRPAVTGGSQRRSTARLDLAAIVAGADDEPAIMSTGGAVRPTGALPVDQEQPT